MAGYLIDRHAQLEATDSLGQTPLHLAITSAEDIFL
jgi:ankyrin repeat protein